MKTPHLSHFTVLTALSLSLLTSCAPNGDRVVVEALTAQETGDSRWGMIDTDGKMMFTDEFDGTPSSVMNGVFTVNESDGISVYRAGTSPQLIKGLDGLYDAGFYTDGLIPIVRPESRIELVDIKGNIRFTLDPVDGHEISSVNGFYSDGVLLFILDNGKVGALDTDGNVVISPIWNTIYWFSEGVAVASRDDEREGAVYIIDNKGNELCRLASSLHTDAYHFRHGKIAGYKGSSDDRTAGFINTKGEFARVQGDVYSISEWSDTYFTYMSRKQDGKMGVMTMKGEVLISPRYDNIVMIGDDMFIAAKTNGTKAIVNLKGEEVKRLRGDITSLINYGLVQFSCKTKLIQHTDDELYYMLDSHGERINKEPLQNLAFYTPSVSISSRYADIDGAVASLIEPLTTDGYNGYKLGNKMSDYCGENADDYTNSKALDCGDRTHGIFTIHTEVRSDQFIVRDTTPSAMYYTWAFNPGSRVTEIEVTIEPDFEIDGLEETVMEALRNEGWTFKGNRATKGNTQITVDTDDDEVSLTITATR